MAAHRYWRIQVRATGGGTNGGIGELEMRIVPAGANVASGGTASASSVSGSYSAAKAFDGLTVDGGANNAWQANLMGGSDGLSSWPWLQYDFGVGNDKDIVEIVMYCPAAGGLATNQMPTAWKFQYSDDNVIWKTIREYQFDSSTTAWAASTSRVYDVTPIGAIDIHNELIFDKYTRTAPALGQPNNPTYTPNSPEANITFVDKVKIAHDPARGGQYKIVGSTTSLTLPVPRRVRLCYQPDGRIHAEQYTKADGLFEFRNLALGPWTVYGIDDTGVQNAVIYSHVLAVPM